MPLLVKFLPNCNGICLVTNKTVRKDYIRGYINIYQPEHPRADHDGYVYEHRLVWEDAHNAMLLAWADVHHKNGDTSDNRIQNLEAMTKGQHTTHHRKGIPRLEPTRQKLREHHNAASNKKGRGPYKQRSDTGKKRLPEIIKKMVQTKRRLGIYKNRDSDIGEAIT